MTTVLYLNASPRGEQSAAHQAAGVFLSALGDDVTVNSIDLFATDLPDVTLEVTSAKIKQFLAMDLTEEEAAQWQVVTNLVNEFKVADHYLMGNFFHVIYILYRSSVKNLSFIKIFSHKW